MTNKEFYKDQLVKIALQVGIVAKTNNEIVTCETILCENCDWRSLHLWCGDMKSLWAEEEYIEPKDNLFEFNISFGAKWFGGLSRNKRGGDYCGCTK